MRLCRTITARNHAEVIRDVAQAPLGWRVTIEQPRRTSQQNSLMWTLLEAFADQITHYGHRYDATTWKAILMKAFGKELQFVPSLDGQEIVALGYRTSELSKEEMSDFVEFLLSEGARLGIDFEARRGAVMLGMASQGDAGRGEARQGAAQLGKARQSKARQGEAGRG